MKTMEEIRSAACQKCGYTGRAVRIKYVPSLDYMEVTCSICGYTEDALPKDRELETPGYTDK
jgi:RNase P subunit RPR2